MLIPRFTLLLLLVFSLLSAYAVIRGFFGLGYNPVLTPLLTLLAFSFALLHSGQRLGWGRTMLLFESMAVATGLFYPFENREAVRLR
jgi:hypothetical protein